MMRFLLTTAIVLGGALLPGCAEEPQYKGVSPTLRSFKDQASTQDYYVGLDYKWALDRPKPTSFAPAPEAVIHTPSPSREEANASLRANWE